MIPTMQYLAERPFPQRVDDFVPICEMVVVDNKVVASVIIVAVIVRRIIQHCRLLLASGTNAVDGGEVEDFFPFEFRKVLILGAFKNR